MQRLAWVNGQPCEAISSFDRGLAFGDGVFETIARSNGRWVLWNEHLERLKVGLHALDIPCDLRSFLAQWQLFAEACGTNGVAKVVVTRGESNRGYCPASDAQSVVILQWFSGLPVIKTPLSLGVCSIRLAAQPALAGFKHLNRLEQVIASREVRDAGWDDGLLLDGMGRVVESTSKNIFVYSDGMLTTPPIKECGVAGTLRNWILKKIPAEQLNSKSGAVVLQESPLTLTHVLQADEIFLCNSIVGVVPVAKLNDRCYQSWPLTIAVRDWVAQTWGISA